MTGVASAIRSKSSSSSGMSSSRAIAIRCSTPLVEPPVAAIAAIAFSRASRVMICDGRTSSRTSCTASSPARSAAAPLPGSRAGTSPSPPGEMPRNSSASAIVFAVNCPPHAPAPGHATPSSSCTSSADIFPAACAPTASNTSWIVTSRPRNRPGAIEPL